MAKVAKKMFSNKYYYVNDAGEKFGPYDAVEILESGKVKVTVYSDPKNKEDRKQGILAEDGKEIIAPNEYYTVQETKHGYFYTCRIKTFPDESYGTRDLEFWGLAAPDGTLVIGSESILYKRNDISVVNKDFAKVYNRHVCISDKYEKFYYQDSNGCFIVCKDGKWGLLSKNGKEIFAPQFDDIRYGKQHISVKVGDKWGVVDYEGNILAECKYEDQPHLCGDNLIIAKYNGKYGIINYDGKTVVPFKYSSIYYQNNGYAEVVADKPSDEKSNYCHGLINVKTGEEVVPCNYYDVKYLTGDYACVQEGSRSEFADEKWVYDMKAQKTIGGRSEYIYAENDYIICADLGRTGYYSVISGKNGKYVDHVNKDGLKRFEAPRDKEV